MADASYNSSEQDVSIKFILPSFRFAISPITQIIVKTPYSLEQVLAYLIFFDSSVLPTKH